MWQILKATVATVVIAGFAGAASADSISPLLFSADLGMGESVTVSKTVVVSAGDPESALIDVHFLIDTSGSMEFVIDAAKAAAENLFTGLDAFGDVAAGAGVFSEGASLAFAPPGSVINSGLTTNSATTIAAINSTTLNVPDNGGDFPESGFDAIALAGNNLEWRDGSTRFMFLFTDASGKGDFLGAAAALAEFDIDLYVLGYTNLADVDASYGPLGTVLPGSTDPDDLVDDILSGISTGFATYEDVTVSDLGGGLPNIAVSTVCTGANIGACFGDTASGKYDRSEERTFTFDVTFTRIGDDDADFETYALIDGGIVAREKDSFPVAPIPVPAALPLLLSAVGMMGFMARRRKAA